MIDDNDKENSPDFVYMEKGIGTLTTLDDKTEDPSSKYYPIGYITGKPLGKSSIKSIEYTNSKYYDYEYLEETSYQVDLQIELKNRSTGLLVLEFKNDKSNNPISISIIPIINGKGDAYYSNFNLPYKLRGCNLTITPKFFCESNNISKNDYTITKPFSVTFDSNDYSSSYSGEQVLSFPNHPNGLVIYSSELTAGGTKKDLGEINNGYFSLLNHEFIMRTYIYAEKGERLSKPDYRFYVAGFIPWKTINQESKN